MTGWRDGSANGTKPDLSQSRFFCNNARKGSLVCGIVAFAALVIGGGFAEISSDGSPTSLETAVVRWVIVGVARHRRHALRDRRPHAPGQSSRGSLKNGREPELQVVTRRPARHLGQTERMGSAGDKPRKQKRRLAKVPKYEEPNSLPAQGLTGSSGGVYGGALRAFGRPSSREEAARAPRARSFSAAWG